MSGTQRGGRVGGIVYAEVKALASGNPLVLEKAGIDTELGRSFSLRALLKIQKI